MAAGHLDQIPGAFPVEIPTPNESSGQTQSAQDPFSAAGLDDTQHKNILASNTSSNTQLPTKATANSDRKPVTSEPELNLTDAASSVVAGAATVATAAAQAAWRGTLAAKEAAAPTVASAEEKISQAASAVNESLPDSARHALGTENATGGAQTHQVAALVPSPVQEAHKDPEAAASTHAVKDKAVMEGELLARTERAGPAGRDHVMAASQTKSLEGIAVEPVVPETTTGTQAFPVPPQSKAPSSSTEALSDSRKSPELEAREHFLQPNSSQDRRDRQLDAAGVAAAGFTAHNSVVGHGSKNGEDHTCSLHGSHNSGTASDKSSPSPTRKEKEQEPVHISDPVAGVPVGAGVYNGVTGHGSEEERRQSDPSRQDQTLPMRPHPAETFPRQPTSKGSTTSSAAAPVTQRAAVQTIEPETTKSKPQQSFPFSSGSTDSYDQSVSDSHADFGPPSAAVTLSGIPAADEEVLVKRRTREDTTYADRRPTLVPEEDAPEQAHGELGTGRAGGFGVGAGRDAPGVRKQSSVSEDEAQYTHETSVHPASVGTPRESDIEEEGKSRAF